MDWNGNLKELDNNFKSWSSLKSFRKNMKNPFDSGCKLVEAEVVSKAWMQKKMALKDELFKRPLHIQKLNYAKGVYELKDHVEEEALNSNLPPKLEPLKKFLS